MRKRNPFSPWNPGVPAELTPSQFEETVLGWVQKWALDSGQQVETQHLGHVAGGGGSYKIDVLARIEVFGGAAVVILVECKHQRRPVEREDVMVLEAKLRDVGAHKGMLFSTSGFQKGALQYATAHGIATITVVDGTSLYETRGAGDELAIPPPWARFDRFAGIFMTSRDESVDCHTMDLDRLDALREWFVVGMQPKTLDA